MRLLLDTHILVWAAISPGRFSAAERHHLRTADDIVVSAVSVWEVRLKWFGGPRARADFLSPDAVLTVADRMQWLHLPLTAKHSARTLTCPLSHTDPFDELLLVQAQEENLLLLTRDAKMLDHPLTVAM